MSETINLIAEVREETGKEKVKKLRAQGLVPAIFYGKGTENINLQLNEKEMRKALHTNAGLNVIINLTIKSKTGEKVESVIPQDVQFDPLTDLLNHIDLRKIDLTQKITTTVPVRLIGVSEGAKHGGILIQSLHEVEVKCLPHDIPPYIEIDITPLIEIGSVVKVGDIKFSDNVEPIHLHPEHPAVSVLAPKKEVESTEVQPLEASAEPEVIAKGKEAKDKESEVSAEEKPSGKENK